MKVLMLDNYDSFTYNLVHLLQQFEGVDAHVVRNDKIGLSEVAEFDKILFSPGPGLPAEAGSMPTIISVMTGIKPMLGVCLGHQAIAEAFGGELYNLDQVMHGIATPVQIGNSNEYLFSNLPSSFQVGRYHSWAVRKESLPSELIVTATDEQGVVMALSHQHYDIKGVQFHPESILTDYGYDMIKNWITR